MKHGPKNDQCLNCGNLLMNNENFCPKCGQENASHKIPFKHIVIELIESLFHVDNKTLQSFRLLIGKPGVLTREFNNGKRVRFVPPVRLYVIISFAFFLILHFQSGHPSKPEDQKDRIKFFSIQSGSEKDKARSKEIIDSLLNTDEVKKDKLKQGIFRQVSKIQHSGDEAFTNTMIKNISYMMFALMPFFAMILMVIFRSKKMFFVEHLIYSIHFHCFLFLALSIFILLDMVVSSMISVILALLLVVSIIIYLFLSIRKVYGESLIISGVKAGVVAAVHIFSLSIFFIITVILSAVLF